jgi:twitching motility protein PilT
MIANGRIQQCITNPERTADIAHIVAEGEYYGMQTFAQSLTELLRRGLIDVETALANAPNPHDLGIALQREGLMASFSSEALSVTATQSTEQ